MPLRTLVLLAALALCVLPASAQAPLMEINFGTLGAAISQWPIYIATDHGFFRDAGLHVSTTTIAGVPAIITTTATKGVDIASIGTDSLIAAVSRHLPVKIVAPGMAVNPYSLVVGPSIKTFADLKGKTVILGTKSDVTAISLRAILAPQHVDFDKDISIIVSGSTNARFTALISGNVQGAMLSPPFDLAAEAQGMHILASAADYEKNWMFTVYIANTEWAAAHRPELTAFARAMRKAVDYGYGHRKESIDALIAYSHVDQSAAERSYDNTFRKWRAFDRELRVNESQLRTVGDAMIQIGELPALPPVADLYDPSYARDAAR